MSYIIGSVQKYGRHLQWLKENRKYRLDYEGDVRKTRKKLLKHIEELKHLMESVEWINLKDMYGSTLLHYACECGDLELVVVLMGLGASLVVKDQYGYTPVIWAALSNNLVLMEFLLGKGVSLYDHVTFQKLTVASYLPTSLLEPLLQFLLRDCLITRTSDAMMSVIAILQTKHVSIEFLKGELTSLHPESCPDLKEMLEETITLPL